MEEVGTWGRGADVEHRRFGGEDKDISYWKG